MNFYKIGNSNNINIMNIITIIGVVSLKIKPCKASGSLYNLHHEVLENTENILINQEYNYDFLYELKKEIDILVNIPPPPSPPMPPNNPPFYPNPPFPPMPPYPPPYSPSPLSPPYTNLDEDTLNTRIDIIYAYFVVSMILLITLGCIITCICNIIITCFNKNKNKNKLKYPSYSLF